MNMANEYIDRGLRIIDVANILHVPRCAFYRVESSEKMAVKQWLWITAAS